jgi:hypothetical protein
MQIVSTIGPASGSTGGAVASRGRIGQQLRAGRPARQPRSSSQQNARALTGSLAALWRALTPAQRQTWNELAATCPRRDRLGIETALSGYSLFVSCNRNLLTIGAAAIRTAAPSVPSIPPLASLAAVATYTGDPGSLILSGFALTYSPPVPLPWAGVLRMSAALSPARGNVRPSDLRIVQAFNPLPSDAITIYPAWVSAWGAPPPSGAVTFALNLVDPLSGFASCAIRAIAPFSGSPLNPYIPGTITVSFEGTPEATLTGQVIEFGGNPQAGG